MALVGNLLSLSTHQNVHRILPGWHVDTPYCIVQGYKVTPTKATKNDTEQAAGCGYCIYTATSHWSITYALRSILVQGYRYLNENHLLAIKKLCTRMP
jgi:hypothetical protein